MGLYAMTGSASGIGAAVRAGLEGQGHEVIGVDLERAEIIADLSTPEGRAAAIDGVVARAPDGLDGFVSSAGIGPQVESRSTIVSLNFYGSVALVVGLKALVASRRGVMLLICSNSATLPGLDPELVESMLEDDEARSRDLAERLDGYQAYGGSKLALTRWMRRNSSTWAPQGVRLNAVAPGATMTPLLQGGLDHPQLGDAIRNFPIPTGGFGAPEQVAAAVLFLLGAEAAFCNGAVLFVDGGTDAMLRPDDF
jgi:NAD(P)-dependent dehydrogenase (short-subunit alcohol dehydrogenase family)